MRAIIVFDLSVQIPGPLSEDSASAQVAIGDETRTRSTEYARKQYSASRTRNLNIQSLAAIVISVGASSSAFKVRVPRAQRTQSSLWSVQGAAGPSNPGPGTDHISAAASSSAPHPNTTYPDPFSSTDGRRWEARRQPRTIVLSVQTEGWEATQGKGRRLPFPYLYLPRPRTLSAYAPHTGGIGAETSSAPVALL